MINSLKGLVAQIATTPLQDDDHDDHLQDGHHHDDNHDDHHDDHFQDGHHYDVQHNKDVCGHGYAVTYENCWFEDHGVKSSCQS